MKALKIVLIVVAVLIVLFLVVALFLPKGVRMEESIVINKPASLIYKQVNNFKNWEAWSPFQANDPEMITSYDGPGQGVGAKMSWTSKKGGDGHMLVTESVPYRSVTSDLNFGMPGAINIFQLDEANGATRVNWIVDIPNLGYPVGRYIGMMMPSMMKEVFKQGLNKLKEVAEAMPDPPSLQLVQLEEKPVVSIVDSCYWSDMESKMDQMYSELMAGQRALKFEITGAPMSLYHKWDEQNQFAVFENCLPVDREVKSRGRVQYKVLPATRAVLGTHFGAYDQTMYLYVALDEFVRDFGLEMNGGPIEEYITDPTMEPDTTKWQTNIYFPVK